LSSLLPPGHVIVATDEETVRSMSEGFRTIDWFWSDREMIKAVRAVLVAEGKE
jgi:hypothetical protein